MTRRAALASLPRFYSVDNGDYGTVYLNGREQMFCVKCKTGKNGWVKVLENDGVYRLSASTHYVRGKVEFVRR